MKRMGVKIASTLLTIIFLATMFAGFTSADGGIISPYAVYEYAQNAVIAWNDGKEYLCLEVGLRVYFAEEQSEIKALRVIPFPSLPRVLPGNEKLFEKMLDFIESKDKEVKRRITNMPLEGKGVSTGYYREEFEDVIYYGSVYIGPHTVGLFRITSSENMNEKVREVFKDMGIAYELNLDSYGEEILERYIENGYNYFAFDAITIKNWDMSSGRVAPVAYIFNTSQIYYPVEITFMSPEHYSANTIALYVITSHGVDLSSTNFGDFKLERRYRISEEELGALDKNITSVVSSGYLDVFLGREIERGVETWNFEARENTSDPYLREMIFFFAAFAVIASLTILSMFLKKERRKRKVVDMIFFGVEILLLMIIIYLMFLHYQHLHNLSDFYSSTEYQGLRDYYYNQLYALMTLSLILLILHYRVREKYSMALTLLAILVGVIVALEYMDYISLPLELFGILMALFLIIVVPYVTEQGFNITSISFQKTLSLAVGIPLFIFAFIPGMQVLDVGFSALFMGLAYLRGEIKFGSAIQEKE